MSFVSTASILLAAGIPMLIINPPFGVLLLLVGGFLAFREDKEEAKYKAEREQLKDAENFYESRKWTHPTAEETLEANEAQMVPADHKAFLNRQIEKLEKEYKYYGIRPHFPDLTYLDSLFENPEKYITVAKFLNRAPIIELVEDWNDQIIKDEESFVAATIAKERNQQETMKLVADIKKRIIELANEGISRKEIIIQIKTENRSKIQLIVFRSYGIWHVELDGEKINFQT